MFAVDGASAETHERYRIGSSYVKIMETLREVISHKPAGSKVGVQFVVTRYNEHEIQKMSDIVKQLGADYFWLTESTQTRFSWVQTIPG